MKVFIVTVKCVLPDGNLRSFYKGFSVQDQETARNAMVNYMTMNKPDVAFQVQKVEEFRNDGLEFKKVASSK